MCTTVALLSILKKTISTDYIRCQLHEIQRENVWIINMNMHNHMLWLHTVWWPVLITSVMQSFVFWHRRHLYMAMGINIVLLFLPICTCVGWLKRQCATLSLSKSWRSLILHWENSSGGLLLEMLKILTNVTKKEAPKPQGKLPSMLKQYKGRKFFRNFDWEPDLYAQLYFDNQTEKICNIQTE